MKAESQNGTCRGKIEMWLLEWNEALAISLPPPSFDEPQPNPNAGLSTESPPAEMIRTRNDPRWSEQSCCCGNSGHRGHEEWRWPDRRSRRNTQVRRTRRNAW